MFIVDRIHVVGGQRYSRYDPLFIAGLVVLRFQLPNAVVGLFYQLDQAAIFRAMGRDPAPPKKSNW